MKKYFMGKIIFKVSQSAGITLIEIMVVTLIVAFMIGGIFMVFSAGQAAWFNADTQIQLQQDLRQTVQRISSELRQTKENTNALKDYADVADGTGAGGSDILKFSIPIICISGGSLIDPVTEDIEYWGAPLNWGCTSVSCMDQDGDCGFLEYKYIRYLIDANRDFKREVLDENNVLKKSDVFAQDIVDFQVVISGNDTDGYIYTLSVTTQKDTVTGRTITAQASINVYLRN